MDKSASGDGGWAEVAVDFVGVAVSDLLLVALLEVLFFFFFFLDFFSGGATSASVGGVIRL